LKERLGERGEGSEGGKQEEGTLRETDEEVKKNVIIEGKCSS
jgi:hypothetical protein